MSIIWTAVLINGAQLLLERFYDRIRSPIREHTHRFQVTLLEKRNNPVIEHISSGKSILPVTQLGKPDFGANVDDGLLINMSHTFDMSHIASVLGDAEIMIIRIFMN